MYSSEELLCRILSYIWDFLSHLFRIVRLVALRILINIYLFVYNIFIYVQNIKMEILRFKVIQKYSNLNDTFLHIIIYNIVLRPL